MRLKRLEVSGFKTFRDKTALDFAPGISGIIGPNGCGKSNIVDAIRWAMGEQRLKNLRGKKMEDLIFNGAEGSSSVGMTEVTLTLASDGKPFGGAYANCSEVAVSRRLFREGESEYYINRTPCRLLDVREFFMDTGVGARTYSLVEQNSVSSLVEAKPEERRQYIEEAAGIAKYKSRKEAALRKMEATKQNMLRLHDIIKEVKTQLNVISRQAKRAEQYKDLKKQVREAELALSLKAYWEFAGNRTSIEKDKEAARGIEDLLKINIEAKESSTEEIKIAAMENEEMVNKSQERLYEVKNIINMKEQSVEFSKGKIADIISYKDRNREELKLLEDKGERIEAEIEALCLIQKETEQEIKEAMEYLSAAAETLEKLKKTEKRLAGDMDAKKSAFIDIASEKAKLSNMEAHLSRVIDDIIKSEHRQDKEAEENNLKSANLSDSLEQLKRALEADEAKSGEYVYRRDELLASIAQLKLRQEEKEHEISELKEDYGRRSARLASLQEFHEGYTWCSEGIKSIMKAQKDGALQGFTVGDFLGLVADHIDVPKEYEVAVEAVLGDKLQYIVVKSQEDGVRAIDYLKESARGRGTFVPLSVRNYSAESPLADHLQGALRLREHVKAHNYISEVITYLLGDVLLIEDLKEGISLWRQNGFRGTFVTPEGDMISPQGVLTGGSRSRAERSLLANKRETAELKKALAENMRELKKKLEDKNETNRRLAEGEEELRQVSAAVHSLEIAISGRHKDIDRYGAELNQIEQRLAILAFEKETLEHEKKEAQGKKEGIINDLAAIQEKEKAISIEMSELKYRQEMLRTDIEDKEKEFTTSRILLASREEKRDGSRQTLSRLETMKAALIQEIKDKQSETGMSDEQAEELQRQIESDMVQLDSLYKDFHALEKTLSKNREEQQNMDIAVKTSERELKELKQKLDVLVKETNDRELALREVVLQMNALRDSVLNKHHENIEILMGDYSPIHVEKVADITQILEKARGALENFGEVNLIALTEYEELKERYDFLIAQDADISASLSALQRTIERINRISRKRFADTFGSINACFIKMFERVFPGGRGELKLTDGTDMLETGVDIDIKIPGKKAQHISLLSGGEKTLAAIALIFAILQYRPSPFLVLDEVDAALDDANISLFNKLLCDISADSQIIMVTHNKKTMEVAENLFGVTMQNSGVSSLVSVNLN